MKVYFRLIICLFCFALLCSCSSPSSPSSTLVARTQTPDKVTTTVTGRIIAAYGSHDAVSGLSLSVDKHSSHAAVTDQNGAFTITDLPTGTLTIHAPTFSFPVTISFPGEMVDVGTVKEPISQPPAGYAQTPQPVTDLDQMMRNGQNINFDRSGYDYLWKRPTLTEQKNNIWSKSPYNHLPQNFLDWWFQQPAVVFDTIDILPQNDSPEYAANPLGSEWLSLLGIWNIAADGKGQPDLLLGTTQDMQDILEGKLIEVLLMDYQVYHVVQSGDHYFLSVRGGGGFNIIRFKGNAGKPYQVHLIEDGQEIARLPYNCKVSDELNCSQPRQTGLLSYPVVTSQPQPTPTSPAYAPKPTTKPPSPSRLQVINQSNLSQLAQVWRVEPLSDAKLSGMAYAFSPDGEKLAISAKDQVALMDMETAETLQTFSLGTLFPANPIPQIQNLVFDPTGRYLVADAKVGLVVWDVSHGRLIWKVDNRSETESTSKIIFSPNQKLMITTSIYGGSDVRIWDIQTGRMVRHLGSGNQLDVAFSPDGKYLYTVDRITNTIQVWDTISWEQTDPIIVLDGASSLLLSPDGKQMIVASGFISGGPDKIKILSGDGWKVTGEIENLDPVSNLRDTIIAGPTLNPSGDVLAFVVQDFNRKLPPEIHLWNMTTQKQGISLDWGLPIPIESIKFTPDGKLLAVQGKNGTTVFWGIQNP